jgi:hypothetical protein
MPIIDIDIRASASDAPTSAGDVDAGTTPVYASFYGRSSMTVGTLVALEDRLMPVVLLAGPDLKAVRSRSILSLSVHDIGREVLVAFVEGDLTQPVVVGRLIDECARPLGDDRPEVEVDADGRSLVVSAKNEIVLRCGKASITLTNAGKVVIRGTYVVSRSSGVNRVKGGTVEIN